MNNQILSPGRLTTDRDGTPATANLPGGYGIEQMELNKLKTFYVLAQTKNYSRCARKLYVTQSAVSHAIRSLESSVGAQLVSRGKKGFALTDAGNTLFRTCCTVFFELDKARERLAGEGDSPEVIRLGSTVEFGISILLKNMKTFLDRHPGIHVDYRLSHNLLTPLLDDELDMIIDCHPHVNPELQAIPLFHEEYAVVASGAYVEKHGVRTVDDLSRCNILSMDRELLWWGNFINALPPEKRGVFNRVTEINHIRGIINAARSDIGVGFVPRYTVLRELGEGALTELFPELDILNDHINIYIKRDRAKLDRHVALIDHIRDFRLQ